MAGRPEALRRSLLGCHTLIAVRNGAFLSLIDPPADAAERGEALHEPPHLAGPGRRPRGRRDLLLSSPIILYDHPEIAPESRGDLFDATEIDEILTLRIMTMSDAEKTAARATDARARAIIDAAESIPAEMLDRLHGAIRYLRETPEREPLEPDWPAFREPPDDRVDLPPSVWQPDARVPPDRAAIEIGGVTISKGASVRLRPNRRADSMDIFPRRPCRHRRSRLRERRRRGARGRHPGRRPGDGPPSRVRALLLLCARRARAALPLPRSVRAEAGLPEPSARSLADR